MIVDYRQKDDSPTKLHGQVREELENGDYLVRIQNSLQEVVVPKQFLSKTRLLGETEFTIVEPIWALLHIHPSGKMSLSTSAPGISKKMEEIEKQICDLLPIKMQVWEPLTHSAEYEIELRSEYL